MIETNQKPKDSDLNATTSTESPCNFNWDNTVQTVGVEI